MMNLWLPVASSLPPMLAMTPLPGRASKELTSGAFIPSSSPRCMMARASGCSLFCSRARARRMSSSSLTPSAGMISVTFGSPEVMVPVLSRATMSILPASSREAAVLNRIPFFAPMPLPTMMATGVARPSAQGQLMTSTEMPRARE